MLKILELAAERLKQVKPKKIFFLCTDNTQFLAAAFPAGLFCLSAALHASNVNEFSVREYETAAQEPKILLLALQTRSKTPTSFQLDLISAISEGKKKPKKPPHSVTLEGFWSSRNVCEMWRWNHKTFSHGPRFRDLQNGPNPEILYSFLKHTQLDRVVCKFQKEHLGKEEIFGNYTVQWQEYAWSVILLQRQNPVSSYH